VQRNCDGIPLEFHSHCNSGLAPQCYLEAVQEGVTTVHTAVAPLANGTSLPSTETMLKNIHHLGFASDLDEEALEDVSNHFRQLAQREGLPVGSPLEYDLFHFKHQVPGGMISNLTRQLREVGMEDRTQDILNEVIQVRKELGYPVMATPFSQIVGAQAIENIVSGKRYDRVPDEVVKYILGLYGTPDGPLDDKVMERINQLPQAIEFKGWKPEGYYKSLEELRGEIGPDLDDEELLLTILIPGYKKENLSRKPVATPTPAAKPAIQVGSPTGFPTEFQVDVEGEEFTVKVSPVWGNGEGGSREKSEQLSQKSSKPKEIPPGAVISGMAGLVLSIDVQVGDQVDKGDQVAVIEAMKMMRNYMAPHGGTVKEICVQVNDMVETEDILMVIE